MALRGLLVVTGLVVIAVGLNVGMGGIRTLGLQVPPDFVAVANPVGFAIQDSHTRFLGGLFLATGVLLVIGAFALRRLRSVLVTLCCIMPVAGLFRLTDVDAIAATMPALMASLAFEFVVFPALALAIWRLPDAATSPHPLKV